MKSSEFLNLFSNSSCIRDEVETHANASVQCLVTRIAAENKTSRVKKYKMIRWQGVLCACIGQIKYDGGDVKRGNYGSSVKGWRDEKKTLMRVPCNVNQSSRFGEWNVWCRRKWKVIRGHCSCWKFCNYLLKTDLNIRYINYVII